MNKTEILKTVQLVSELDDVDKVISWIDKKTQNVNRILDR